jgi:hypothetical protein
MLPTLPYARMIASSSQGPLASRVGSQDHGSFTSHNFLPIFIFQCMVSAWPSFLWIWIGHFFFYLINLNSVTKPCLVSSALFRPGLLICGCCCRDGRDGVGVAVAEIAGEGGFSGWNFGRD